MTDTATHKPLVFSGMQPTGNLHLGNYLGAMLNWIKLQETQECIYCVVDMHAITLWQEPKELHKAILEVTAAYLACGLDPKRSIIFNQSQVQEHAELAWIFNCVARMGWLNRMTQFKEKAGKDKEQASVGLYVYPNLMAADILAYKATHVPVGEDQKQHLELARDIAGKFNLDFGDAISDAGYNGDFFPQPEPFIIGPATRVMSLRDGAKKMSKSDPSDLSRINLSDDAETIAVRSARRAPIPIRCPTNRKDWGAGRSGEPHQHLCRARGLHARDGDRRICGRAIFRLQERARRSCRGQAHANRERNALALSDPAEIDRILKNGAERATAIAAPVMAEVRRLVGFVG